MPLERWQSSVKQLLHLRDSPHRTALAFAVGAFIAFSPTYGLHTVSVFLCAWAFRLNVIALFAGAFLNNPWTLIPILGATLWTGFSLFGMPDAPPFSFADLSVGGLYEQILPYAAPFFVGGFILSVAGALAAYPIAYWLISRYRARRKNDEASSAARHP
jgi:uncharacterized protein (DUF2062 family)